MKVITGSRGSDKTTKLIEKIKEEGGVLIVHSEKRKRQLVDQGVLSNNQILTPGERAIELLSFGHHYYIDDIELLIERWFGPGCEGFSIGTFDLVECRSPNGK